jgi:hypothetical protein
MPMEREIKSETNAQAEDLESCLGCRIRMSMLALHGDVPMLACRVCAGPIESGEVGTSPPPACKAAGAW